MVLADLGMFMKVFLEVEWQDRSQAQEDSSSNNYWSAPSIINLDLEGWVCFLVGYYKDFVSSLNDYFGYFGPSKLFESIMLVKSTLLVFFVKICLIKFCCSLGISRFLLGVLNLLLLLLYLLNRLSILLTLLANELSRRSSLFWILDLTVIDYTDPPCDYLYL